MSDQWRPQPTPDQPPNTGRQTLHPGQFQTQQPQPKKKRSRPWIILSIVGGLLVLSCILCGVIESSSPKASNTGSTPIGQTVKSITTATKVVQVVPPTVRPTATPTPKPTPTPVPTQTQAQIEASYKASTTSTTVTNLDKDGNADQGKDVHFICKILKFVKDSTGNTAGANVTATDSYSDSIIQVAFTPGTDITQLNEGDILEVWGTDEGVFSGTNAFGGTVQEVGITALYMFDQTTNYQANT